MVIESHPFVTGHRKGNGLELSVARQGMKLGIIFGKIQSAQRGIEVEVQSLRVAGLSIAQSCKLLGISKDEFNLKPGFVMVDDLLGIQLQIGRE